ncbi:NYN domain-containing protein [Candidatus Berkelbacteria bacterium]|nr:NYN domain-containing protein [Candidatus Berkelbacteria bacterium]
MSRQKLTHLYIDGQNFISKIRGILVRRGIKDPDITKFDFWGMLNEKFKKENVDLAAFYGARVLPHEETKEKSEELLIRQQELQEHLQQQGFKYVLSGIVRAQVKSGEVRFVEKGVDVKIAIDAVVDVLKNSVGKVILATSDSDLQPAVKQLHELGADVVYMGFRNRPNQGLIKTTDRYILISNDDVVKFYPQSSTKKN